jgi:hypothetical protein
LSYFDFGSYITNQPELKNRGIFGGPGSTTGGLKSNFLRRKVNQAAHILAQYTLNNLKISLPPLLTFPFDPPKMQFHP